jgi:acetyl/propionyl-CoA carboxylase alpha subunit
MSTTTTLRHGEHTLEVTIVADGEVLRGRIGDRDVEARRLPASAPPYATAGASVQEITLVTADRTHHATVVRHRDRILVALRGRTYAFTTGNDDAAAHRGVGTGQIAAPMPGKIIAVVVQVGDRVATGAPVLVMEAMKMETTLTADIDGEVTRVAAVAGETVDAGVVLVEITPA